MTKEVAFKAISFAVDYHKRNLAPKPFVLGFFGGEPLLEWELLQECDEYASSLCKECGLNFGHTLTTNLTLLTKEKADWLIEKNFTLGISLDGTAKSHNTFRKYADGTGSHSDCIAALKHLEGAKNPIKLISVINPETTPFVAESVQYLSEICGYEIGLNVNVSADWTQEACEELKRQYEKVAELYVARYRRGRAMHITTIDGKIKTLMLGGYRACDKCSPVKKELAVDVDGRLYPCPNMIGETAREDICLGDVFTGFNDNAVKAILSKCGNNNPECKDCPIASRCLNWCTCVNYSSTGKIDIVSPFMCFHEKLCVELADKITAQLLEEKNQTFLKYFQEWGAFIGV
jgi:uncharacterized protein